jgi:signal-transduction protein with cAMP-binding, CBS, and nucleotidyltransferase domain
MKRLPSPSDILYTTQQIERRSSMSCVVRSGTWKVRRMEGDDLYRVPRKENVLCHLLHTFREVLQAVNAHNGSTEGVRVGSVMVPDPLTVAPDMEISDLRRLMIEKHMRYLPIAEDGTLLGVISFLDVAKAVLEEQGFENRMLKSYIKNWPDERTRP